MNFAEHRKKVESLLVPSNVPYFSASERISIREMLSEIDRLKAELERTASDRDDLADAVECLRRLGEISGCDHVQGRDDRVRQVRCIEETFDRLKAELAQARATPPVPATDGLLPCPFCGSTEEDPTIADDPNEYIGGFQVTCWTCEYDGPRAATVEVAKELWNHRAAVTPPVPAAIVEDEEEELHAFEDKDEATRFRNANDNRTVRLWGSDGWHWHPAKTAGDAG